MIPGTSTELNALMSFVEGDTWGGIPSITITVDGVAPSTDASLAVLEFRRSPQERDVAAALSSADGEIVITSANDWEFTVPSQNIPTLRRGRYVWGFKTTDVSGAVQTYLQGSIEVLPKVVVT